ncbi:MAG: patatin-like phospholipase family protein [Burkholderiaceae bacterium]
MPSLNLALQGGGAHGAFTWGVLDALLAEPRLSFEGISGTSAGAMNAAILAEGWRFGSILVGAWENPGDGNARPGQRRFDRHLQHRQVPHAMGGNVHAGATQSHGPESAARLAEQARRFRCAAQGQPVQTVHRGDRSEQRQGQAVPRNRTHDRHAARLGVPAENAARRDHRRRALLGRRLFGEPCRLPPVLRLPCARHPARAVESTALRDHAAERRANRRTRHGDRLQRPLHARDANVRERSAIRRRRLAASGAPGAAPAANALSHGRQRSARKPAAQRHEAARARSVSGKTARRRARLRASVGRRTWRQGGAQPERRHSRGLRLNS